MNILNDEAVVWITFHPKPQFPEFLLCALTEGFFVDKETFIDPIDGTYFHVTVKSKMGQEVEFTFMTKKC